MSWWQRILETIEIGDEIYTPGRGMEGNRQRPFTIIDKDRESLIIKCGRSPNKIKRKCFDCIEGALEENNYLKLRISSVREREPLPNSCDKIIREEARVNLPIGNYVCAILEKIEVVKYVMDGRRKCIELTRN